MLGSKLLLLMGLVVITAVANTISRKLALIPLSSFPYVLTQLAAISHVLLYGGVLSYRKYTGRITNEMLSIPMSPFIWIGLWEALGLILGNIGTANLPGYFPPILNQLNLPFTAAFQVGILKSRYDVRQCIAISIVIGGSIISLIPNLHPGCPGDSCACTHPNVLYIFVFILSVVPAAFTNVLKERVFKKHGALDMDIFVVNTYGSIFTLIFSFILVPFVVEPGSVRFSEIPLDMKSGLLCFAGYGSECTGAPYLPLSYMVINIAFNIAFLSLVKHGCALLSFVTNSLAYPAAALLFALSWPMLEAVPITVYVVAGLFVEATGALLFRYYSLKRRTMAGEMDRPLLEKPQEFDYQALASSEAAAFIDCNLTVVDCCLNEIEA